MTAASTDTTRTSGARRVIPDRLDGGQTRAPDSWEALTPAVAVARFTAMS